MDMPLTSKVGSAKLLWYIATADGPVTVDDLVAELDSNKNTVGSQLRRLWRSGFVLRRNHPGDVGKMGKPRFQYVIAPREPEGGNP